MPHSSIIGPLLFLLCINDLPLATNNSLIDMCADDSTTYISGNNYLTNINMLRDANNMTVNPTKSTCMLIGSTHRVEHVSLDLHINSMPITEVHTQKLLGIFVDKHLKWDKQIDSVNQAPIQ